MRSIDQARGRRLLVLATAIGALGGAGQALAAGAPTKATSMVFAKAVNLAAADVPGFAASVSHSTPGGQHLGRIVSRCAGGVDPAKALVNIDSPDFTMEAAQGIRELKVSSNVTVLPSARLAAQDLKAVRSARGRACLASATRGLFGSMKVKGIAFGKLSLVKIVRRAPGSDGIFGLRFKVTASSAGLKIPFYIDAIGFTRGPAEIGLTTLGVGEPFPAAQEQMLLTLLAGRASFNRV